jgi:hypothetical protein
MFCRRAEEPPHDPFTSTAVGRAVLEAVDGRELPIDLDFIELDSVGFRNPNEREVRKGCAGMDSVNVAGVGLLLGGADRTRCIGDLD